MHQEDAAKLLKLIHSGQRNANRLWNLAQDMTLPTVAREAMRVGAKEWDNERTKCRDLIAQLKTLPPAFDPIELGC